MINQWTYCYWDTDNWYVYRQVPDPLCPKGRVVSTEIARGRHNVPSFFGCPDYYEKYAAKQIEIGLQYSTDEWPFKTCQDEIISK